MPKYVGRIEKDIWGNDRIVARREASAEDYIGTGIDIGFNLLRAANQHQRDKYEQKEAERLAEAMRAAEEGRFQDAISRINSLIERIAGDDNLYWCRAQVYYGCAEKWQSQGNSDASDQCLVAGINDCNTAVRIGGPDPAVISFRGVMYLEVGSFAYAVADANFCVQVAPHAAEYHAFRSNVLYCLGDNQQALMSAEQAVRLEPNAYTYSMRGRVYYAMPNWSYPVFVDKLILGHLTERCPPPFVCHW